MSDRLFAALLKYWRGRSGLSQLDLALAADVSSRHVSYLETGRAQPSQAMVLRLFSTLGVPLRHQNEALAAAGFARRFAEPALAELPLPIDDYGRSGASTRCPVNQGPRRPWRRSQHCRRPGLPRGSNG